MTDGRLTFEVTGVKEGVSGSWQINADTLTEAKQKARTLGIQIHAAVLLSYASPAREHDSRSQGPIDARIIGDTLVRMTWREALNFGFWAGLGAWCASMIMTAIFIFLAWSFSTSLLSHWFH